MPDQPALHHIADEQHHRYGDKYRERDRPVHHYCANISEPLFKVGSFDLQRLTEKICFFRIERDRRQCKNSVQCHSAKRAEHKQSTMGKVHHTQCAENKCQSERDQRIGAALIEPV